MVRRLSVRVIFLMGGFLFYFYYTLGRFMKQLLHWIWQDCSQLGTTPLVGCLPFHIQLYQTCWGWYPEMGLRFSTQQCTKLPLAYARKQTNLGFKAVLTLQYQKMEHSLAPSTCTQTPVVLLAQSWAYLLFRVRIPGQCIPGTVAHRENLQNTRTRDICIGSGNSHPGLWLVLRCKNGQSTCTDL